MMKNWLDSVTGVAINGYVGAFGMEPDVSTKIVAKNDWASELQKRGVNPHDRRAIYLLDEILIREDATYFDVLHEFGHEAFYQSQGIKETIKELRKTRDVKSIREMEAKFPLELVEESATDYAKLIGNEVKSQLPDLIRNYLGTIKPKFAAITGSVIREGWGENIKVWFVVDNPEALEDICFPPEWDLEFTSSEEFQEGVTHSNGIYYDLMNRGEVIIDAEDYRKTLFENMGREPSTEEFEYHFRKAYILFLTAKKRLAELELYAGIELLKENSTSDVMSSALPLAFPSLFFNPLSHAVSYAYIGCEYKQGRRTLISGEEVPLLYEIQQFQKEGHHQNVQELLNKVEVYLSETIS